MQQRPVRSVKPQNVVRVLHECDQQSFGTDGRSGGPGETFGSRQGQLRIADHTPPLRARRMPGIDRDDAAERRFIAGVEVQFAADAPQILDVVFAFRKESHAFAWR